MKNKVQTEINRGNTEYRIHVQGKMEGEPETIIHTYRVKQRPATRDEATKIAGDFVSIDKLAVEEVTTLTKIRLIKLD